MVVGVSMRGSPIESDRLTNARPDIIARIKRCLAWGFLLIGPPQNKTRYPHAAAASQLMMGTSQGNQGTEW